MTDSATVGKAVFLALGLLLSACGGGSSGGGSNPFEPPGAADAGDTGGIGPMMPGDDPGLTPPGGTAAAGSTDGTDAGDPSNPTGGTDNPLGNGAPPISEADTTSGRLARVLATSRGPVIGVPGGQMGGVQEVVVETTSEFIAYTGDYQTNVQGGERRNGVWAGSISNPELLFSTGSSLPDLPETVRFQSAANLRLGRNGSLGMIASLDGSRQSSALVTSENGVVDVLVETGNTLQGLSDEKTVSQFTALDKGVISTAFVAETDQFRNRALWLSTATGIVAVAESRDDAVNNAPRLGNCRVFLPESNSSTQPEILTSGVLVFPAEVRNYAFNGPCERGAAVMRYIDGIYEVVVANRDTVPGAPDSTFSEVSLYGVTDTNDILVVATLLTPTGLSSPDRKLSYWSYPSNGGTPNLIALEGEEVDLGDMPGLLPGQSFTTYLTVNGSGQVAMRVSFGDSRGPYTLLGGRAHNGQPHAAVTAPGASALAFLANASTPLPAPNVEATFFSEIGLPAVDSVGNVVFAARVRDAELSRNVGDGVWQVDPQGALTQLVSPDDTVLVAGTERQLVDLFIEQNLSDRNDPSIWVTSNGAAVLVSDRRFSSSSAVIYLVPAGQ